MSKTPTAHSHKRAAVPRSEQTSLGRRALLRKAIAASSVLAGAHLLPERWFRPLVAHIVMPAHAQTSGPPEEPPATNVKQIINYTGGDQTFVVPLGVTSLTVVLDGGDGGGGGGAGGLPDVGNGGNGANGETRLETISVVPGETLIFRIGGGGAPGQGGGPGCAAGAGGDGGYPDGASGTIGLSLFCGGGGGAGGTTSILRGGIAILSAQGGNGGGGGGETSDGNDGRDGGAGGAAGGGNGGAGFTASIDDGGIGGSGNISVGCGTAGFPGSNGQIEIL